MQQTSTLKKNTLFPTLCCDYSLTVGLLSTNGLISKESNKDIFLSHKHKDTVVIPLYLFTFFLKYVATVTK